MVFLIWVEDFFAAALRVLRLAGVVLRTVPVLDGVAVFFLAAAAGLIGHWVDQKRQDSRLIRLFDYLVNYAAPKRREVPPLK